MFKKNTQIAEFYVVTPKQAKYIKPVHLAISSVWFRKVIRAWLPTQTSFSERRKPTWKQHF